MIRAVVAVAVAWALWRKVSRKRRYALGLLATAGLAVIGACLGGIAADEATSGNDWTGELLAGVGAVAGCLVLVYAGELVERKRKGWPLRGQPPPPPPRKLSIPSRRKKK